MVLIQEGLSLAHKRGAIATKDLERVVVDTTVQPKAIAHPTDARLMHRAIVHRFVAAFLAISWRRFLLRALARAFPPLLPSSAAALRSGRTSSSSPSAIRITFTALPITSAGRFSPRGPLGIGFLLLGALDAQPLADNLPHGISLDASALLVGLREALLGLGDYRFHDQGFDQP